MKWFMTTFSPSSEILSDPRLCNDYMFIIKTCEKRGREVFSDPWLDMRPKTLMTQLEALLNANEKAKAQYNAMMENIVDWNYERDVPDRLVFPVL